MNKLEPNSIRKYYKDGGGFRSRENISLFRKLIIMVLIDVHFSMKTFRVENAARTYGLKDLELFQTVDLYEKRNISQVTDCIFALARHVKQTKLNIDIEMDLFVLFLGRTKEFFRSNSSS